MTVSIKMFSTNTQCSAFFKLPADKQPSSKYLKKKEKELPLSESVLGKVFSNYNQIKGENPDRSEKKNNKG